MNLQDFAYSGNPIKRSVSSTSPVTYEVSKEAEFVANLTAEPFNGKTEVDFAPVIRSLYSDKGVVFVENTINDKVSSRAYLERELCVMIDVLENDTDLDSFVIIRGVLQNGEQPIDNHFQVACLSDSFHPNGVPYCKSYGDDYPAIISLLYLAGDYIMYHRGKPIVISHEDFYGFITTVEMFDFGLNYGINGSAVINRATQATIMPIFIEHCELPEHPFYIRWINNRGGWNTFMFSCNQTRTRTLESNLYLEKEDTIGEQMSYHKEGKEVIETSSGLVDMNIYEKLSWLQYSPVIQRYEPDKGWYNVQIDKCDATWQANSSKKEMIISFVMPTLQMNK